MKQGQEEREDQSPPEAPENETDDGRAAENLLDYEARFLFLLNFSHGDERTKEAILNRVAPRHQPRLHDWMRSQLMHKIYSWRHQLQKDLLVSNMGYVFNTVATDSRDIQILVEAFRSQYSTDRFFHVFKFIRHRIDLDRSSPLAKFYTQEAYSNFCARARLTLDWKANPNRMDDDWHLGKNLTRYMEQFTRIRRSEEPQLTHQRELPELAAWQDHHRQGAGDDCADIWAMVDATFAQGRFS
ncbi:hypothetical protein VE03_03354 [Pseudogymnoascus sp. 23342-1-I1]|nr:hypothetical protein VE03_03354 [Pseudogymnoascus sp. 23342-1-I1]